MTQLSEVHLFTDGGCSGNPGPGGWAFLLRHPATGKLMEHSGGEPETTNNRNGAQRRDRRPRGTHEANPRAVVHRQRLRRQGDERVDAEVESQRLATQGRHANGAGQERGPVAAASTSCCRPTRSTTPAWPGHSGHPENDRVDELAVAAYQQFL